MDMMLAVLVFGAVIFFGALISLGNERQRKAMDALREQVVLWAIQDLRIKREHLAREVGMDDPMRWFNQVVAKVAKKSSPLQLEGTFENPQALLCTTEHGAERLVFTPLSPDEIHRLKKEKNSRLSQRDAQNPLLTLPRNFKVYEISVLNGGILFDRELPLAWRKLTGQTAEHMERLWIYGMG